MPRFPWLEPPREATVAQALTLLRRLGRDRRRRRDRPRAARWPGCRSIRGWAGCWSRGSARGQPERAALAAALLSERDPFLARPGRRRPTRARHRTLSDVLDRVEALEEYERDRPIGSAVGR